MTTQPRANRCIAFSREDRFDYPLLRLRQAKINSLIENEDLVRVDDIAVVKTPGTDKDIEPYVIEFIRRKKDQNDFDVLVVSSHEQLGTRPSYLMDVTRRLRDAGIRIIVVKSDRGRPRIKEEVVK